MKRSLESNDAQLGEADRACQAHLQRHEPGEATSYIRSSIITYGIRDWARAPYGAANHGWQPGVRSWKVMDAFKAFDFGSGAQNVHIVGEAYSDYQGFIEGALNSSELALAAIPGPQTEAAIAAQEG